VIFSATLLKGHGGERRRELPVVCSGKDVSLSLGWLGRFVLERSSFKTAFGFWFWFSGSGFSGFPVMGDQGMRLAIS